MTARTQLVLCGVGGQGILFLTRVVAEAAIREGREVLAAETHGMAQRGGGVESFIKIGGFSGSLVRRGRADAVLALDPERLAAARAFLRPGGACFVDAPAAPSGARACDASAAARALEHPRGANLVLLGFAAAAEPALFPGRAALDEAVARLGPPAAREANRRALARGLALGRSHD